MASSRICSAKGCTKEINATRLMCWPHWRMVPRAIQRRIQRLRDELENSRQHARREHFREYHLTVLEAREAVALEEAAVATAAKEQLRAG